MALGSLSSINPGRAGAELPIALLCLVSADGLGKVRGHIHALRGVEALEGATAGEEAHSNSICGLAKGEPEIETMLPVMDVKTPPTFMAIKGCGQVFVDGLFAVGLQGGLCQALEVKVDTSDEVKLGSQGDFWGHQQESGELIIAHYCLSHDQQCPKGRTKPWIAPRRKRSNNAASKALGVFLRTMHRRYDSGITSFSAGEV